MKTGFWILCAVVWCACGACAPKHSVSVQGDAGKSGDSELALCELVIRDVVSDTPPGESVLVSFGESWVEHVDPPKAFFEHLSDVNASLAPVSRYDGYADARTTLFSVHVVEWVSDIEAKIAVTRYRFGVGAADGFTATAKWKNGAWKLAGTSRHWST